MKMKMHEKKLIIHIKKRKYVYEQRAIFLQKFDDGCRTYLIFCYSTY